MTIANLPGFLESRVLSHQEALRKTVKSGVRLGSGFATSEPVSFYSDLWDHIVKNDLTDIVIRNGLFMGPHKLLVGDALSAKGKLGSWPEKLAFAPPAAKALEKANAVTRKLDGLGRLIGHFEGLKRRRIRFVSGFIGAANNMVIPNNLLTRYLYPDYAGRNPSRAGIIDMHPIHFPDALYSLGYDVDDGPRMDMFVTVMTPPNEDGDMSLGIANGANSDMIGAVLERRDATLLIYVNGRYPFTRGYKNAVNTFNVKDMRALADEGKLFVVEDDTPMPGLPADSFANPLPGELAIANNLVNHIELNRGYTYGRAIQVGIGGTGVLAIRNLKSSDWRGRCYTEMLEPFTLELFESGRIEGSHFIEEDGSRTMMDGKICCTFSICEQGGDFYDKLHDNPDIVMAPASRVVVPEAFHRGMGINNILGIDFHGHVNCGGRDRNHFSGVGGAAMINRGLMNGGVAYLCLKSTHATPEGEKRGSIFPFMPEGTPVFMGGPDIWGGRGGSRMFLVTEHGVARLSGKSQSEFISALVSVAHPDHRDRLRSEAKKHFNASV